MAEFEHLKDHLDLLMAMSTDAATSNPLSYAQLAHARSQMWVDWIEHAIQKPARDMSDVTHERLAYIKQISARALQRIAELHGEPWPNS